MTTALILHSDADNKDNFIACFRFPLATPAQLDTILLLRNTNYMGREVFICMPRRYILALPQQRISSLVGSPTPSEILR